MCVRLYGVFPFLSIFCNAFVSILVLFSIFFFFAYLYAFFHYFFYTLLFPLIRIEIFFSGPESSSCLNKLTNWAKPSRRKARFLRSFFSFGWAPVSFFSIWVELSSRHIYTDRRGNVEKRQKRQQGSQIKKRERGKSHQVKSIHEEKFMHWLLTCSRSHFLFLLVGKSICVDKCTHLLPQKTIIEVNENNMIWTRHIAYHAKCVSSKMLSTYSNCVCALLLLYANMYL